LLDEEHERLAVAAPGLATQLPAIKESPAPTLGTPTPLQRHVQPDDPLLGVGIELPRANAPGSSPLSTFRLCRLRWAVPIFK
jgi:hypothetical protein